MSRLSGCSACHTPAPSGPDQTVHQLTSSIAYTQCNTCHNRGNYSLGDTSFHPRTDQPFDRLHDYYQPIAQFTRCEYTLDCVDCHTRLEIMGDGQIHGSKKDIQYVQCRTCHGTPAELPLTITISDPNDPALRMAFLNPVIDLKVGDTILVTDKGEPLWNIRLLPDGNYELIGKATRQRFIFRPVMGSACHKIQNNKKAVIVMNAILSIDEKKTLFQYRASQENQKSLSFTGKMRCPAHQLMSRGRC